MVKIERLTKSFGSHTLFKDLTLQFPQGKLTVIMGPSGCGKSTLLRCINFLELFDSGRISIGDISVEWNAGEASDLPAQTRHTLQKMRLKTGMVFQSFNLFPHLTVLENVTLAPIQVKKMNPNEAAVWEASGIPYSELIDRLIALAIDRHAEKNRLKTKY